MWQAGSTVTVLGSGFGASDYSVGVVVGHSKVAHCTWISDTTLVARVSHGVQGEWGVLATIDGQRGGSITQAFFYDTPVASHIDVKNGPTAGGTRISIFGMNFGNSDYSATASVGKKMCEDVRLESVCAPARGPKIFCQMSRLHAINDHGHLALIPGSAMCTMCHYAF